MLVKACFLSSFPEPGHMWGWVGTQFTYAHVGPVLFSSAGVPLRGHGGLYALSGPGYVCGGCVRASPVCTASLWVAHTAACPVTPNRYSFASGRQLWYFSQGYQCPSVDWVALHIWAVHLRHGLVGVRLQHCTCPAGVSPRHAHAVACHMLHTLTCDVDVLWCVVL